MGMGPPATPRTRDVSQEPENRSSRRAGRRSTASRPTDRLRVELASSLRARACPVPALFGPEVVQSVLDLVDEDDRPGERDQVPERGQGGTGLLLALPAVEVPDLGWEQEHGDDAAEDR